MSKTLIFIKSHIMNFYIVKEYQKYLNIENYDVILALDNTNYRFSKSTEPIQELEFYGKKIKCFLFDENLNNKLHLPNYIENGEGTFTQAIWYNSDYPYYYIRQYFPDYDFYWQIEFDVYCNGNSYKHFFNKNNGDEDLLISHFNNATNSNWYWIKETDWCYKNIDLYKSFFPISRLSANAIDFLYKRRLEIGKQYQKINHATNRWIFCELFTATELINNNFKCKNIETLHIDLEEYDITDDIFSQPDNLLYHPIKYNYVKRLKDKDAEIQKLQQQLQSKSLLKPFIKKLLSKFNIKRKAING